MRAAWFLVVVGSPRVRIRASRRRRAVGRTDVILQWNEQVVATGGPQLQRTLAMVHIAVFGGQRHRAAIGRICGWPRRPPDVDDAGRRAPHGVLTRLFPDQRQPLAAAVARSLSAVPDGPIEDDGVHMATPRPRRSTPASTTASCCPTRLFRHDRRPGRAVDGRARAIDQYRAREWAVRPRVGVAISAGGPPALTSREYARELAEVRDIGRLAGTRRSPDEERIARWHLEQGYVQLNRVARAEAATDGRDVLDPPGSSRS